MSINRKLVVFALVAALPPAGCATLEQARVTDKEKLLAAAGFQARPANTQEKFASLASMPPHKLVSYAKDDHFVYSYADPDYCRCLYVGGPAEYSAYQRLTVEEEIAEERLAAEMDWDRWGPWW